MGISDFLFGCGQRSRWAGVTRVLLPAVLANR